LVQGLLKQHQFRTSSVIADFILESWAEEKERFVKIVAKALDGFDFKKIHEEQIALRTGVLA